MAEWTEEQVERIIGRLLQAGVLLSASVVALGGVIFLARHGREPAGHHVFAGEPSLYRSIPDVVTAVAHGDARAVIQLGLLLLILTPIARVAFSLLAFAHQRDRKYVVITAIVLGTLLYGLLGQR
jgi:uncharacterized membrane protein